MRGGVGHAREVNAVDNGGGVGGRWGGEGRIVSGITVGLNPDQLFGLAPGEQTAAHRRQRQKVGKKSEQGPARSRQSTTSTTRTRQPLETGRRLPQVRRRHITHDILHTTADTKRLISLTRKFE